MKNIISGRMTTPSDRDLVVFLIGARINKWWLLPIALPILARMRKMQQELLADANSGLLGIQSFAGVDVQYWRSVEDLRRYAGDRTRTHQPTKQGFFRKLFRNEAVGIWHETYVVSGGNYESLYVNMPPRGVGKVLPLIPATGEKSDFRGRLQVSTGTRTGAGTDGSCG